MIDDTVFSYSPFILELEPGTPGGDIDSYSMDGSNYDFDAGVQVSESISIIIG